MTDAGDIARMRRIVQRIRARGVRVIFVKGWDQRGATFPVVPNASFVHHDASSSKSGTWGALGIITYGRAGVPPPLSQFQVARGGTPQVAVISAGVANHAGMGGPHKGLPKDDANRETYGTEVANSGAGERYSDATITAIRAVQAAVAEECQFGPYHVIGHKEWTPRKIDPTYSMTWLRGLVAETMQEDDMPDEKTVARIVREQIKAHAGDAVWGHELQNPRTGGTYTAATPQRWGAYRAHQVAAMLQERAEAIADAVAARLGGSADVMQIRAAVGDELRDILGSLDDEEKEQTS